MSTKQQLESRLKDAMRAGDEARKRTIRSALAAIKQIEIDKRIELDEAGVLAVIQKEVKIRQETIEDARKAARPDLEEGALAEIEILREFLPKALSEAELEELARQVIAELGVSGPQATGQVMKALMPRLGGRATGDQAGKAVRKLLQ